MLQNSHSTSNLTDQQRERAAALGIPWAAVRKRLSRGWPPERATGELARIRLPKGQRQTYGKIMRGRWSSLAQSSFKFVRDRREVEAVCQDAGLPVPRYVKPSRGHPPKRRFHSGDPLPDLRRVPDYDPGPLD